MKIIEMRRMLALWPVWSSIMVGRAVMANRMHIQGLEGRPQKNLAFLHRNLDHPKNGVIYHTKIVEMRGMLASRLVWPSIWVGQAVMANRMHIKGFDGRPRKYLAFLTSKSRSPTKWCAIALENRQNEAYARFGARLTFQMGRTSRDGQPYA